MDTHESAEAGVSSSIAFLVGGVLLLGASIYAPSIFGDRSGMLIVPIIAAACSVICSIQAISGGKRSGPLASTFIGLLSVLLIMASLGVIAICGFMLMQ